MKLHRYAPAVIVCLFSAILLASEQPRENVKEPNLLVNGDFSAGREGWTIFGHRDGLGEAELIKDAEGNQFVRMTKTKAVGGPPGAQQMIPLADLSRDFELTADIKSDDFSYPSSSQMAPSLQVFFKDEKTQKTVHIVTEGIREVGKDWQTIKLRFSPVDSADQMQVLFITHGMKGSIDVDNIYLRQLPKDEGAWSEAREAGEWVNNIDSSIKTKHVPWGNPLSDGALKVGMVIQRSGKREAIELKQRLEVDLKTIVGYHPTALGVPARYARYIGVSSREKRFEMQALLENNFDVFVIGNLQWNVLPAFAQQELIRRVREEAMGLVVLFQQDEFLSSNELKPVAAPFGDAVPLATLPFGYEFGWNFQEYEKTRVGPESTSDRLHTWQLGKGRIAHIRYTYPEHMMWRGKEDTYGAYGGTALSPHVLYDGSNMHQYEQYMMLLAHACLWAGNRNVAVAHRTDERQITAGQPTALSLRFDKSTAAITDELEYKLIDNNFGVPYAEGRTAINGLGEATVNLPAIPAGDLALIYQVIDSKGANRGFGALPVRVEGDVDISSVQFTFDDLTQSECTLKATVSGTHVGQIIATVTDLHDRVVLTTTVSPTELSQGVKIKIAKPVTSLHRLDLAAKTPSGDTIAAAHKELMMPGAPTPDYLLGPYTSASGLYPSHLLMQRISNDFHNNAQYEIGRWRNVNWPAMSSAARADMQFVSGFRTLYKARPWSDEYRKWFRKFIEVDAKELARQGVVPTGIACGDESHVHWGYKELVGDDVFQAAYLPWLQDKYRSLDQLNRSWRTTLTSWKQATPITLVDAHQTGQYVRWYDAWRFVNFQFIDILREARDITHQYLPEPPIGFEDPIDVGVATGYDIPKMFDVVTFYGAYQRYGHWLTMRSFAKPDAFMFSVSHARTPDPYGRQGEWQLFSSLFHGFKGHLYHRLEGSDNYPSLGYDLSVRQRWTTNKPISTQEEADRTPREQLEFVSFSKQAKKLNEGIAKLVLSADRKPEQVAIFHNTATVYANFLVATVDDSKPTLSREYSDNLMAPFVMEHLLNDAHVTYRMVSDEQVLSGLAEQGIRTLILPRVHAMSRQTADAIRKFVREGGVLVAGVRPAVMDENCQPLTQGMLDDVFGVKSKLNPITKLSVGSITSNTGQSIPIAEFDSTITLTTGKATGQAEDGTPVLITNTFGKGHAQLWNILPRYNVYNQSMRDLVDAWGRMLDAAFGNAPTPQLGNPVLLSALRDAISRAGVKQHVEFVGNSKDIQAVELWEFNKGSTKLIGLSRRNYPIQMQLKSVDLKLARNSHVYDVINNKYLGQLDQLSIDLGWGSAALLALSPDKLPDVNLTSNVESNAINIQVTRTANDKSHGGYHITVTDSKGKARRELMQNIIPSAQSNIITIPLAINDPAGPWQVNLKHIITGQVATISVQVPEQK